MQPILAESAPHRGRAIALTIVLAIVASASLALAGHPRSTHREHHHVRFCKYAYSGTVFVLR